jgi:hypothetical protein
MRVVYKTESPKVGRGDNTKDAEPDARQPTDCRVLPSKEEFAYERNGLKLAANTALPALHQPKILGKWPLVVDPLRVAVEACLLCQSKYFLWVVFVGTLGPNRLVLIQRNR